MSITSRSVRRFDQVRFVGPGRLRIVQTDSEALTVRAPAYVMPDIVSEVTDGLLTLGYRSPRVVRLRVMKEAIVYNLSMRDIRNITVTGPGSVVVPDLDNDIVKLTLHGSGKVTLEHLTADVIETAIYGKGSVHLVGDVELQAVMIKGTGRYEAEHLVSDFAHLGLSGGGEAGVSVTDALNLVINGVGQVTYAGFPDITKSISGSGSLVRRRREKEQLIQGEDHG